LPALPGVPRFGLAVCDSAGALTFRRPIDGFSPPRSVAACPLWPLFQALMTPDRPLRQVLEFGARPPVRLLAHAVAGAPDPLRFDAGALRQATMLLTPAAAAGVSPSDPVLPVGSTCRICPRPSCEARREPSIVSG
jgi:predicted transcriptional regulator